MSGGTPAGVSVRAFRKIMEQVLKPYCFRDITVADIAGQSTDKNGTAMGSVMTDGSSIGGNGTSISPLSVMGGGSGFASAELVTNGTVVAAGSAQAQNPLTVAGAKPTTAAMWSLPTAPDATWQTGIFLILVCTVNTITAYLVNPTAGPITPIAQLVNIKAIL